MSHLEEMKPQCCLTVGNNEVDLPDILVNEFLSNKHSVSHNYKIPAAAALLREERIVYFVFS